MPLQESHLLSRYVGLQRPNPNWRSLGKAWAKANSRRIGRPGSGGRLAQASSYARNSKRVCICRRRSMAERIRRCLSLHRNPRPTKGNRSNQDRHGKGRTHGPSGLRWRWLRKNGSRPEGSIQGGHGRQTGRGSGADAILCQQHLNVFRERMADYPIEIEMLTRFRTAGEQKKILRCAGTAPSIFS